MPVGAQEGTLPLKGGSVRFAVIGDMGTGDAPQYDVSRRMAQTYQKFPFNFVIMLGDNIYGSKSPGDMLRKFQTPYASLLDGGVQFYAALGNHDDKNEIFYKFFNMNGQRYYTFRKGNVEFFVIDSSYFDPKQTAWLDKELANSGSDWKICYFSSPPVLVGHLSRFLHGVTFRAGTYTPKVRCAGCICRS